MTNNSNIRKSLSLSNISCRINNPNDEIFDLIDIGKKGELYKTFVGNFLKYIPVDYRSKNKISLFGDFTQEAFDFFSHKSPSDNCKIDIHTNECQNNPSITILIASENRSFIIDSISSLMNRLSLQPIFIFHPVICGIRDKKGKLKDIVKNGEGGINESLVYIKILGTFDGKTISNIKKELHNLIDLVDYTYNSWQVLLNKVITITTNIIHNEDLYEGAYLPTEEALDFLNWIQKNNVTFLGAIDFDVKSKKITKEEGVREIWKNNLQEISTIIEFSTSDYYKNKITMLGKINKLSPVHRNALVDYILVKHLDKYGKYKSGTIVFGLYGTAIYFQSIKNIPILRKKMNYVLDQSGFSPSGYNAKKIKNIIESLPRDVLIQIDEEDLYCICIHMLSSMRSRKLKLFIQQEWSNSFINVIIFLPRERLTPEVYNKISCYLVEKFNSDVIADNITVVAQNFSHLFVTLAIKDPSKLEFSHDEIESDLVDLTTSWSEGLLNKLCEELGEYKGSIRYKEIEPSFPAEYKFKFDSDVTIDDVHKLEDASRSGNVVYNLTKIDDEKFSLKIYSSEVNLTLSDILPAIENLGFTAIEEQSFDIKESSDFKQSWIYEFELSIPQKIEIPFITLKTNIEEALCMMNEGLLASDVLSKLLVLSGLKWTKVKLVKALIRYLHQTGFTYGKGYAQKILVKHNKFTEKLLDLFAARLDPDTHSEKTAKTLHKQMLQYLDTVSSSTEDKTLRNMMLIVEAVIRTNFYQTSNKERNYLSFKFRSSKVPDLPLPVPYAEIFVYSSEFEGIHLRGGKVARGGLRWSDRGEDYRTEVLGLMKSQMTKNAVIVPVGSKGTFYLNFSQGDMSREEYMEKVVSCYQNFLRGLLDVTDNLVDGKIVQPKKTVIYDDANPYLVVAADKGTASFSDYANAVSEEYNFWLKDAFASGGSVGYDHKKMGITAKGAWVSAQVHFLEMGVDIQKEPFTVVGIGDMSGDVFGNGMLLSQHIKLVAAFNHEHIFIDPNPDCKSSYNERKRLFTTPRTKWSDYNSKYISKGGGVFERSAKTIEISKEVRSLLNIENSTITPDKLIQAILKAEVGLIWNGGIGTYIKSSKENNIEIGDKANDNLRINGEEVKAKVVSEGGNLGLSQLGRIEYAMNGGRVNTDFIDNSAGVDCSDHEVNIKIALNSATSSGKITLKERNQILEKMTNHVADLVLLDNYDQNLAITISSLSKAMSVESFGHLINALESEGLLDSKVEFLPDKSEISKRIIAKKGMSRPELAVLLSYTKMSLEKELFPYSFREDKYFRQYLFDYFPKVMHEKFKEEIENHPLREEIIKTIVANKLVNQLGGLLIHSIKKETGASPYEIAKAYVIVTEIFDLNSLWKSVENIDSPVDAAIRVELYSDLSKIMRRGISWFVKNISHPINVSEAIKEFSKQSDQLTSIISNLLVGATKTKFFAKVNHYSTAGVNKKFAKSIATLEVLVSAFDIIYIGKETRKRNDYVANLYFETGDAFSLDWLRQSAEAQIDDSYWNRLSIQSLKDDFYSKQRQLTTEIIKQDMQGEDLKLWMLEHSDISNIFINFIEDIKMQESVNLNMLVLAGKKLEIFLNKLKR
ncbi:NAD-glutamate dehydrogenase [Rickettsiaceae bacterium]|nr:NAD-glutamate dehydrogenase [Rickettsiaceae bacterium]